MKYYLFSQDSDIEWIGKIPKDWKILPLKRVSSIVNGSTPDSSNSDFWDGEIHWITPSDLGLQNGKKLIGDSSRKITRLGLENCGASLTPKGSILLSTRAPIGHMAISIFETCTNQGCKTIVINQEKVDGSYLYYYLLANKQILQSLGQGSTFIELSSQNLKDFVVIRPSLVEQKAIADYLDRKTAQIDTLIAKKQRQIELLQEQQTAIINQAVTKGLDPSLKMKDSGISWLGHIPEHWNVVNLRWLVNYVGTGKTPPTSQQEYYENDDVDWFTPVDLNGHIVLPVASKKIDRLSIEDGQAPLFSANTVLIGGVGTIGKIGILLKSASANQQINAISYNSKFIQSMGHIT